MESFSGAPRVLEYLDDVQFENTWGEMDCMSLLVVSRLGKDLEELAGSVDLSSYGQAYAAALHALRHILKLGVSVPDPHPCNLALEHGGSSRAVPCDYGSMSVVSEVNTHKLLK